MEDNAPLDPLEENDCLFEYEVDDNEHDEAHYTPIVPGVMQSTPEMALMALKITNQTWDDMGHGNDPNVAASNDLSITVERITSLMLIRIVAIVSHRNALLQSPKPTIPKYSDISTTTICLEALNMRKPWPKPITRTIIHQLRAFVRSLLEKYNKVHYHSFEHAYHVTISCNKLMDMMLMEVPSRCDLSSATSLLSANMSQSSRSKVNFEEEPTASIRKTYGLKNDPLMSLAMLFSALAHDVEHKGVPNRQLVLESDELAILYNDQSVAEQRSLAVAFSELKRPEFDGLRAVVFESDDDYRRFRKTVINLVLATDIASPERTQLVKSKWKEAFGETKESMERKKNKEMSRRSVFSNSKAQAKKSGSDRTSASLPASFKGTPQPKRPPSMLYGSASRLKRRGSPNISLGSAGVSSMSMMSDLTNDQSIRMHGMPLGTTNEYPMDPLTNIRDDESEEGDTTSHSATPESVDGLSPAVSDEEEFLGALSGSITAARSASPSVQRALTNGIYHKGNPLPDPFGGDFDHERAPEAPSGTRRQTDGGALAFPADSGSVTSRRTTKTTNHQGTNDSLDLRTKLNRCYSSPDIDVTGNRNYSMRLSIRRSLDLTGEAIENYSVSSRNFGAQNGGSVRGIITTEEEINFDPDDTDELKASVVMEHIIRAADIGPTMQGWEQMKKWSGNLFFELKSTHEVGRGEDPETNWFEGQLIFLESYILPLARRLDDMGVFGDTIGPMFQTVVQQNKSRWLVDGMDATAQAVQDWEMRRRRQSMD